MIQTVGRSPLSLPAPPAKTKKNEVETDPSDSVTLSVSETVPVSHRRELRGCWIASVWNINFPSSTNASATQQKQELVAMVDRLKECGFNAIFFHVRPDGDALYKSELEPWSSWLTGQQGKNPGYDPLEFLIQEAHKKGLEVHAWLNPYRAQSGSAPRVKPHMAVEHPEHVHPYGNVKWMDPGAPEVRQRLVDVCKDLTRRYDVDGIHFDDYFYPYPREGEDFPDQRTWNAYQGPLSKPDWRRENVNRAVREVNEAVKGEKDHVRFGISPFGLPAPDRPPGVSGFDQYEGMYADTQKWMDQGWVDYLAPQLYWPTTQPKQPYGTLVNWWADHSKGGRYIFAGNDLSSLGKNSKWTIEEFRRQVALSRAKAEQGSKGNIFYHIAPLMENRQGIVGVFRDEFYAKPALTPPLSTAASKSVEHPSCAVEGNKVTMTHRDGAPLRAWTVYKDKGGKWELERIVPGEQSSFELPAGRWAVAAATKHGVESQGVVLNFA